MYIASMNSHSRIAYKETCYHTKLIKKENNIYFNTIEEAESQGYRYCMDCCDVKKKIKDAKRELKIYCIEHKMETQINRLDGSFEIKTPYSQWKVVVMGQNKNIFLFHKNSFTRSNTKYIIPDYHLQRVFSHRIMDYCYYIVEHDLYRQIHPLHSKKSKRIKRDHLINAYHNNNQKNRIKRMKGKKAIRKVEAILHSYDIEKDVLMM